LADLSTKQKPKTQHFHFWLLAFGFWLLAFGFLIEQEFELSTQAMFQVEILRRVESRTGPADAFTLLTKPRARQQLCV
jgi:hypothetical protein